MANQWLTDMGGRVALNYQVLFTRMDRLRLDDEAWEALFADIRTMEAAALDQMAADRDTA